MKKTILLLAFISALFGVNSKDTPFFKDVNSTCPIKFIDVFTHPNWIAALEYKDGQKVLFSSVKPMFHYLYEISSSEHSAPIKTIYVSDFSSGDLIEASEAFYVFGSRIMSASGDDLIAFATIDAAREFATKNSGHKILEFKDINKNLIDYLE